ncbi:DUF554 domain-containing protein [Clostridium merdae]|uniref:DUF554 domain-containing protein n=1 Tax=Clostridium merdae TaxID=1958780 RepID=UPI000A26C159|nr:DUF554 domain-containing protein [Clostridium merdae]
MLGTIVNTVAILVGGALGLLFQKRLNSNLEESLYKVLGVAIFILGLNGVIHSMFTVQNDRITSGGELLLVISLVVGTVVGELLRIENRLEKLSQKVEQKMQLSGFSSGFVAASILYCVGAMAIVGAINDGLRGDSSTLLVKSILDGVSAVVMASTLGVGVIFSAVPVLLYQGSLSLLSGWIGPAMTDELLNQICMVGYAIVMCIGINFWGITKIKTANLLPSILVPVFYYGVTHFSF